MTALDDRPASDTPEQIIARADAEIAEADAALAALEERVLDDDPNVGPDDIEQARSRKYFAGLARKRAEKKATALREAEAKQARTVAILEARRLLDEVPQADVDQALKAASDAMQQLRETVRAHNDARARAIAVLNRCPAIEQTVAERGVQAPALGYARLTGAYSGHGQVDKVWALWVDHKPRPALDENQLMDAARKAPAVADDKDRQAAAARSAARRLAADVALWRSNWPAFEALGAGRRKAAVESTGMTWDQYLTAPGRPRLNPNAL
ncbi:hypothetical protein ACIRPX_05145 [Streptomyces sp. NPDC101225]|uniref:hypothetical protein n=1 Tax=Streptomyces sp. NPDC101225 TaxID=3366135 RepID=UPI00380E2CF0